MPVSASYVFTADDLVKSRRIALRMTSQLSISRLATCAGIALPLTVFCWSRGWHHFPDWFHFAVEGGTFVSTVMLLTLLMSEWMLRLKFLRHPQAGAKIVWEISEDGIVETVPFSRSTWEWSFFQRVVVTPAGMIFYPNFMIFHFLPARAFTSPAEMEAVAEMASRLVPDFRRSK